jgi:hypothetical protein
MSVFGTSHRASPSASPKSALYAPLVTHDPFPSAGLESKYPSGP